jgi:hypothetical protein
MADGYVPLLPLQLGYGEMQSDVHGIGICNRCWHFLGHHGADLFDPRCDEESPYSIHLGRDTVHILDCFVRHLWQGERFHPSF